MTQCERILIYMRENDGITTMDAFRLGCTRLSARIADLKKDGNKISSERVTVNKKTFVRYHLVEEKNGKQENVFSEDH